MKLTTAEQQTLVVLLAEQNLAALRLRAFATQVAERLGLPPEGRVTIDEETGAVQLLPTAHDNLKPQELPCPQR